MKHAAILLAAGYSTRMGTPKALLPWNGLPLIEFQIQQLLKSTFSTIFVVLGHQAQEIKKLIDKYPIQIIINNNYPQGKTSSIIKGVVTLPNEIQSFLIVPVDTPIESNTVDQMLNLLLKTQSKIIIPVYSGKRGHPILIDASLRENILTITEEKLGLRELITEHKSTIGELVVKNNHVLYNLNTKSDYETLKKISERRHHP
jgi:molybdenum cofactor cytidylyltransferase